ncbi:MAG: hypothetical protein J6K13_04455 [Clostridia bacterium]|nr:hypothetical protein [Clostridia bacterium]
MKRKAWIIVICIELVIVIAAGIILWQINQEKPLFEKKPAMYMEPAEAQPLYPASFNQTYNFRMDDGLKSVVMEIWELKDGQWTDLGGGRIGASLREGQFSLSFNDLPKGITYSVDGASYTYTVNKDFAVDFAPAADNGLYTTMLTQLQEITYETPIPVAMQIYTANQSPQFIGTHFFYQPEKLASEGHDHVYAVTLTFSQTTME